MIGVYSASPTDADDPDAVLFVVTAGEAQEQANKQVGRPLTDDELERLGGSLGDALWQDAENIIDDWIRNEL